MTTPEEMERLRGQLGNGPIRIISTPERTGSIMDLVENNTSEGSARPMTAEDVGRWVSGDLQIPDMMPGSVTYATNPPWEFHRNPPPVGEGLTTEDGAIRLSDEALDRLGMHPLRVVGDLTPAEEPIASRQAREGLGLPPLRKFRIRVSPEMFARLFGIPDCRMIGLFRRPEDDTLEMMFSSPSVGPIVQEGSVIPLVDITMHSCCRYCGSDGHIMEIPDVRPGAGAEAHPDASPAVREDNGANSSSSRPG